jgi:predicted HTH domain antitoxin
MTEGYIYILFNRAYQSDYYKIGMTTKTPQERALEISSATGVPRPFEVLYEQRVADCRVAEGLLHRRLDRYRSASNREFFELPLKVAIKALEEVADGVGRLQEEEQGLELAAVEVTPSPSREVSVTRPRLRGKGGGTSPRGIVTFEDHADYTDVERRAILIELRRRVLSFDDLLRQGEKSTTYHRIAYKVPGGKIFLEVKVQRAAIVLHLVDGGCLDPNRIAVDIPPTHEWAQLKKRIIIVKMADLDEAMPFIAAAYRSRP